MGNQKIQQSVFQENLRECISQVLQVGNFNLQNQL